MQCIGAKCDTKTWFVSQIYYELFVRRIIPAGLFSAYAKTYRINRMLQISPVFDSFSLNDKVKSILEKMIKYGPQYPIVNDDEMCVRLSDAGISTFNKIYYGRPDYERIEKKPDGYYYYFRCSEDQVFFYFRRFQGDEAIIMFPESLRIRMKEFHSISFSCY